VVFSVSPVTTLVEWVSFVDESTLWVGELEWPDSVVDLLEVGSYAKDLLNEVFNTDNLVLLLLFWVGFELSGTTGLLVLNGGLNNVVGGDWNSLAVDLHVSSLVE